MPCEKKLSAELLTKKRWQMIVMYAVINMSLGAGYAWSIFSGELTQRLGAAELSFIFTLSTGAGCVTMIVGGILQEKIGLRRLLLIAGVVNGLGVLASGFATAVWQLVISFGLCGGLAASLMYGLIIGNSVRMFPDRRGMAGGIATATYGISSILTGQIASALISRFGLTVTFLILGVMYLVLACGGALLVTPYPADFVPVGWDPRTAALARPKGGEDYSWRQMVRTGRFYVLLGLMICGVFPGIMAISHAAAMATNITGLSFAAATTVVSLLSGVNTASRLAAGALSDRIGRINTLRAALIIALAGLGLLASAGPGTYLRLAAGFCALGASFGTFLSVYPGLTADQFGMRNNTVNYGVVFFGYTTANLLGAQVAGRLYLLVDSYVPAFGVAGLFAVAGLVLTLVFDRGEKCAAMRGRYHSEMGR